MKATKEQIARESAKQFTPFNLNATAENIISSALDRATAPLEREIDAINEAYLNVRKQSANLQHRLDEAGKVNMSLLADLVRSKDEAERACAEMRDRLNNFVCHYDERDIKELRTKHWGSSAGEVCAKDILQAFDTINSSTCGKDYIHKDSPREGYRYHDDLVRELIKQINEAEKDKKRLDWLNREFNVVRAVAQHYTGKPAYFFEWIGTSPEEIESLRESIDSAMNKEKEKS